jgi:hypothetical protein
MHGTGASIVTASTRPFRYSTIDSTGGVWGSREGSWQFLKSMKSRVETPGHQL